MRKDKASFFKPFIVAGFFLCFAFTAEAQPNSGGPQPSSAPTEEPATGVPLDGGASLLLAAGAAYGLKKVNEYRKGKQQEPEV